MNRELINDIVEKYVTFEVAKLLKEKGFRVPSNGWYELALTSKKDEQDGYSGPFGWKKGELNHQRGSYFRNGGDIDMSGENWYLCASPTLSVAVEWVRINFGIFISPTIGDEKFIPDTYYINPNDMPDNAHNEDRTEYDTPQEALESGLLYALINLIPNEN